MGGPCGSPLWVVRLEPSHPKPAEEDILEDGNEEGGPGGPEGGGFLVGLCVLWVESVILVIPNPGEANHIGFACHVVVGAVKSGQ